MTYSKELHKHLRISADLKHDYTQTPTQFIHDLLDEIDRLTAAKVTHYREINFTPPTGGENE